VIRSFRSKALERYWWKGDARRIDPHHLAKIRRQLAVLDCATRPEDMNLPGWRFHRLRGERRWAVWVDQNWRLTFAWNTDGPDAVDVDYEDYH
jgi:proteic killer suppression protein